MASRRIDRIAQRPDPAAWEEDELMSLREAARLHWPHGPITERTLRTAVRDGRLPISRLAGKFFVTRRALSTLSDCRPLCHRDPEDDVRGEGPGYLADLAAIDRMGRKRTGPVKDSLRPPRAPRSSRTRP
jgi:hypothetical protein